MHAHDLLRMSAWSPYQSTSPFADRYSNVRVIASNDSGVLALAENRFTKQTTALRSHRTHHYHSRDQNLAVEITALGLLVHPNILKLEAVHIVSPEEIVVATEVADYRLSEILQGPRLATPAVKAILFQLLDCAEYIGRSGVVNCNIHLDTVLLAGNCQVKLASFRHCRAVRSTFTACESPFPDAIHTPPEFLSQSANQYTDKTDVWSIGLVLLELLLWKDLSQLVQPTHNSEFQTRFLGSLLTKVPDPQAKSLAKGLLERDCALRLTAREALRHAYFQSLLDGEELEELECQDAGPVISSLRANCDFDRVVQLEAAN